MSRLRTPKLSHMVGRQRAVARSAAWSLFRPGETRLPNGYRAELGSAFLSADIGITPEVREDHAAYIATWLKALRDDKRLIFSAAAHAQRAADYLHNLQPVAAVPESVTA